jgi:hypothetical protein
VAAFEADKLEAYRQKVRVFFGQEAYQQTRTVDDCEDLLDEVSTCLYGVSIARISHDDSMYKKLKIIAWM